VQNIEALEERAYFAGWLVLGQMLSMVQTVSGMWL
jgi:hypothetical protein